MRLMRKSNQKLAKKAGWSVNEIQFRITGVRVELLEIATSYGLFRAGEDEGIGLDDLREWVAFVQRLDAWGLGGTKTEMAGRLADASQVSQDAINRRVDEARHADWWMRLESLTESARAVEELSRPGVRMLPLKEVAGASTPGGFALLGAIEDSLVLELFAEGPNRSLRLTAGKIHELLVIGRGEGVWEWKQPTDDRYPRPPYRAAGSTDDDLPETVERFRRITDKAGDAKVFYKHLDPDGRELSDSERLAVREQLVIGAVGLRELMSIEKPLTDLLPRAKPPHDFAMVTEAWRLVQRSLVLALSGPNELRARCYPADALTMPTT
jgi:hypothetical protein